MPLNPPLRPRERIHHPKALSAGCEAVAVRGGERLVGGGDVRAHKPQALSLLERFVKTLSA